MTIFQFTSNISVFKSVGSLCFLK